MKTRGNTMKKFYTLFAMLFAATSLFAAGDIYEIRPCDAWGNSYVDSNKENKPYATLTDPLLSGDFYFNIRLVEREEATPSQTLHGFKLTHFELTSEAIDWVLNPLQVGIFVGGRYECATLLYTPNRTPNKSGTGKTQYLWDLVFHYQIKPGDLGLPIKLALENKTPVPENYDSSGSLVSPTQEYRFENTDKWRIQYIVPGGTETNNASFLFNQTPQVPTSDAPEADSPLMNYALKDCGAYVKTVDFKDRDDTKTYWKTVDCGSDAECSISTLGGATVTNAPVFYVWAVDPAWLKAARNGTAADWIEPAVGMRASGESVLSTQSITVGYDASGNPKTTNVTVAVVTIVNGGMKADFKIHGVTAEDDATLVMISGEKDRFPGFTWKEGSGNLLVNDFLDIDVYCKKSVPTLKLELTEFDTKGNKKLVYNVTSNCMEKVTTLSFSMNESYTGDDTKIKITPVLTKPGKYSSNDVIRLSTDSSVWEQMAPLEFTVKAGESCEQEIYVFGLGAAGEDMDLYSDKKGNKITFNVEVTPKEAAEFIEDKSVDYLYFVADAPVIVNKDELAKPITVRGGTALPIDILVADNYTDMMDTNTGYVVKFVPPGKTIEDAVALKKKDGTTAIWKPTSSGMLTDTGTPSGSRPAIPNNVVSGTARLWLVAPNTMETAKVTMTLDVTEPSKVSATAYATTKATEPTDTYNEYDEATGAATASYIAFTLSESYPEADLYAFLAPADDTTRARVYGNCLTNSATSRGVQIPSGYTSSGSRGTIRFRDGGQGASAEEPGTSYYIFDVILCTTATYNPAKVVSSYTTKQQLMLIVDNVAPVLKEVDMSGWLMEERDGELWMGGSVPVGVPQKFSFTVWDAKGDTTATNKEAFKLVYQFFEGGKATGKAKTLTGDPNTNTVTNVVFTAVGTAKMAITLTDKDGGTSSYTVNIPVEGKPYVTITSPSETAPYFNEDGTDEFKISLSSAASEDLKVQLTITNKTTGAKAGTLEVEGDCTSKGNGVYEFSFKKGDTDKSFSIRKADGTGLDESTKSKFTLTGEVTTNTDVPDQDIKWSEFYLKGTYTAYIKDVAPSLTVNGQMFYESGELNSSNAPWTVAIGQSDENSISWSVDDVEIDLTSKIAVTFVGQSGSYVTNVTNTVSCAYTPTFKYPGAVALTITARDKDGGATTVTIHYLVKASRMLYAYPVGESQGIGSDQVSWYNNMKGRGRGHVWAGGELTDISAWEYGYNCGLETDVRVVAQGYRVGDVDNGNLSKFDVAVDSDGNKWQEGKDYYTYTDDTLDSFFYCWVYSYQQSNSRTSEPFGTITPEVTSAISTRVALPTDADENGDYGKTYIEAVFSKELLASDNMGDINQDGIPDAYVTAYKFGLYPDALTPSAADMTDLAEYNDDGDFFPVGFAGGSLTFIPGPTNSWVGRPFYAKYEVRGYFDPEAGPSALNDALDKPYAKVADYKPLKIYEDPAHSPTSTLSALEWDAFQQSGKTAEEWSPERPTDPTKADTDGDGIPDGYEYYVWYKATVGWMDGKNHMYLSGRAYNPQNPFNPTYIKPADIANLFDPLVDGSRDWDTIDTDNDGILDIVELNDTYTNPFDYDTDGDGLPDGYEVFISETDPCDADSGDNPDGDTMAKCDVSMNVIGILNGSHVDYYCCPAETNFVLSASETAEQYNSFKTVTTNQDETVTEVNYVTKDDIAQTDTGALKDDVSAWKLRDGRYLGKPVRVTRGTIVTALNAVNVFEQNVETVPSEYYVAWQYGNDIETGGLARGQKKTFGEISADAKVCYVSGSALNVKWLHHYVFEKIGFDPRTGWFVTLIDLNDKTSANCTAYYTTMDEFLSMTFFYQSGGVTAGDLTQDLVKGKTMVTIWQANATNPLKADTDSDGMPDGWEFYLMNGGMGGGIKPGSRYSPIANFYNENNSPESQDPDADDLQWPQEYSGIISAQRYGWEPSYPMWRSKKYPTNPWNGDTDGDGMLDGPEGGISGTLVTEPVDMQEADIVKASFMYNSDGAAGGGLNPLSWDTDLDGLPDPWETEFAGTYTAGSTETLTETVINGGVTTITERVVSTDATWNMDGMDGTVPDARIDYDFDGLDNWQEYMVGAMRCWRYDDAVADWGSTLMEFDTLIDLPDATDGEFWYKHLVSKENPNLVNGYFDQGFAYFSYCKNVWDPAYGTWHMFRDGVDHVLKDPLANPNALKAAMAQWKGGIPYDAAVFPTSYVSCDPRRSDTDCDGMDDFYELYHGMNPLLGAAGVLDTHFDGGRDAAYDVVYDAYLSIPGMATISAVGNPPSAKNNFWRNNDTCHETVRLPQYKAKSESDNGGYDFIAHPWLNGMATADPDGDGIRNAEEAIFPKVQAASTYHHTDPTPLWMTDTTYVDSLVRKYYRLATLDADSDFTNWTMESDQDYFEYNGTKYYFKDFPNFTVEPIALGGYTIKFSYSLNYWGLGEGWQYSFEENEGYDSDHDYLSDFEELQGKTKSPSDPQVTDDPLRRQAMWFNGTDAFLQTPVVTRERVPEDPAASEQRQNFLYFTAECWALPDKARLAEEQTLIERAVWVNNSSAADEDLLRRNFFIGTKNGKWIGGYDSTGTGKKDSVVVFGSVVSNVWTHLSLAYDGEQLYFYVDGHKHIPEGALSGLKIQPEHGVNALSINEAGEMNQRGGTSTFGADCISLLVGASPAKKQGLVYDYAWRKRASTKDDREGLSKTETTFKDYEKFYRGYIDEVRIWDGARAEADIKADFANRKRYTAEDAKTNRDAVYVERVKGGLRSPASSIQLPPQLMYHFSFDHIPGAIASGDVITVPAGFNASTNVTDAKAGWSRPSDWTQRDWASSAVRSTVYGGAGEWVPWINNTVAHLPRFDLTTLDSVYWSENFAGGTNAAAYGYTSFAFPRNAEVASRRVQMQYATDAFYDRFFDLDAAAYNANPMVANNVAFIQNSRWNVVSEHGEDPRSDLAFAYRFAVRDRNVEGDDLLPMGGAYARRISAEEGGMWDDGTPADAWAQVGKDSNNNGLPDWWEEYARKKYLEDPSPRAALDWDTVVNYNGVKMPAYQAYLRDLAAGLVKNGSRVYYDEANYADTRDLDGDNMPDWWEDMFGIDTHSAADAKADPDNDGLSNYQEYLISEKHLDWGYSVNPTLPRTYAGQEETDYFLKLTDGRYLGECVEINADHDFMEDNYEDEIGTDRTKYDPYSDNDEDGWDAFSELRYRNFKQATSARFASHFVGEEEVKDFPTPVVHATLRYNCEDPLATTNAGYVIEAYTGNDLTKSPNAVYRFSSGATETRTVDLGKYAARMVHGTMTPGHVLVGENQAELKFCFVQDNDLWSWTVDGVQHTGTYDEMYSAYQLGGTNVVVNKQDWSWDYKLVESHDTESNWLQLSVDKQTGKGYFYMNKERAGTFDSVTGDFSLDLSKLAGVYLTDSGIMMEQCFFRLQYETKIPAMQGNLLSISLAAPDTGKLAEGSTTFVAYMDTDGDGAFTAGVDPIGYVKNVEVGWDNVPEMVIEMTDAPLAAGGRFAFDQATVSSINIFRTAVNGTELTKKRNVYGKDVSEATRDFIYEADFQTGAGFALDWTGLRTSIGDADITNVTEVSYLVLSGDVSAEHYDATNFVASFSVSYNTKIEGIKPVSPTKAKDGIVESVRPAFKWTGPDDCVAYRLRINDASGKAVWTSDPALLPPKDKDGNYIFTAPVYVATETTTDKWALLNNTNYTWQVAMYNAKYPCDAKDAEKNSVWSDKAEFTTALAERNDFSTKFGCATVEVSYFGACASNAADVIVQLYKTADFTGTPAAQSRLAETNGAVNALNAARAVSFLGLDDGDYYAVAFVDRDGDGARDKFEIWGYAAQVGQGVEEIWTPAAVTVDAANAKIPAVAVFMEDTDINQNDVLDYLDPLADLQAAVEKQEEAKKDLTDGDNDGITTYDEQNEYYTNPKRKDHDGDGMSDGWEAVFAGNILDPKYADDAAYWDGSVMAYADFSQGFVVGNVTNTITLVTLAGDSDTIYAAVGDGYLGGQNANGQTFYTTYKYGEDLAIGRPFTTNVSAAAIVTVDSVTNKLIAVHATVMSIFGYDKDTANGVMGKGSVVNSGSGLLEVEGTVEGTNTKKMTALDKYLVADYLVAVGYTNTAAVAVETNRWNLTLKPGSVDGDKDGIADGWELYAMFGTNAVWNSGTAGVTPFKDDQNTALDGEMAAAEKLRLGLDPWNRYAIWEKLNDESVEKFTDAEALEYDIADGDIEKDGDNDAISNWQEMEAHRLDAGLKLSVTNAWTDGSTPDYFRTYTNATGTVTNYLGAYFNGAEFIEAKTRRLLGIGSGAMFGTRDYNKTGWDVWSVAQYSQASGMDEETMKKNLVLKYMNLVYGDAITPFTGEDLPAAQEYLYGQYPSRFWSGGTQYRWLETADDFINYFDGIDAMNETIAEKGGAFDTPVPSVDLALKYAGSEKRTIVVEAYQVSSAYPEFGEQLTAKWTGVEVSFDAGVATKGLGAATFGKLKQGPARFIVYIDVDGNGKFTKADTYGMAEATVGYLGCEISVALGEANPALPVIRLSDGSNTVSTIALVRSGINGEPLYNSAKGAFIVQFPNNAAREALYPAEYVTPEYVGIDSTLATDLKDRLGTIESVTYEVVRLQAEQVATLSVSNLNHYVYIGTNGVSNVVDQAVNEEVTIKYSLERDVAKAIAVAGNTADDIKLSFTIPTDTANMRFWLSVTNETAGGEQKLYGGDRGFLLTGAREGVVVLDSAWMAENAVELKLGKNKFAVILGNDKYGKPDSAALKAAPVAETIINTARVYDGTITVDVKHALPTVTFAKGITVAAYEKQDLAQPVAYTNGNASGIVTLKGLRAGVDYYVAAWYVKDAKDGRKDASVRRPYDTWGYVNNLCVIQKGAVANTPSFDAAAVEAKAAASVTNALYLQDTDWNDNGTIDREEDFSAKDGTYATTLDPEYNYDIQGIDDGDLFISALESDVMAYATKSTFCVAVGTDEKSENWIWYAVTDMDKETTTNKLDNGRIGIPRGTPAKELKTLFTTYRYGNKSSAPFGLGTNITLTAGTVRDYEWKDIALVHNQVYREFGFDPNTANALNTKSLWVNTKILTRKDKSLVTNYLAAVGAIAPGAKMSDWTLSTDRIDYDFDGIPDGWELYTMFGTNPVTALGKTAKKTVLNAWVYGDRDFDTDDDGLTNLHEYNGGEDPLDPWDAYSCYNLVLKDDSKAAAYKINDGEARKWDIVTGTAQLSDRDNDGLSNWAEFLAYKKTGIEFDVRNAYTTANVLDYFVKTAEGKYVGESLDADGNSLITDHDFMEDAWEDLWDPADVFPYTLYANRYVYDANLDGDEDGWKNWSECRSYFWGCGFYADIIDTFINGNENMQLRCFPQPTLGLKVTYNGRLDSSWKRLIVRTYTKDSNFPDAIFQVNSKKSENSSTDDVSDTDGTGMSNKQILGVYNGMPILRGYINPGLIVPSLAKFEMTPVSQEVTYHWNCTECALEGAWANYVTVDTNGVRVATRSGVYAEYKVDITNHGDRDAGNDRGVHLINTTTDWTTFASSGNATDGRHGKIYYAPDEDINAKEVEIGEVDYRTGEFWMNLDALKVYGLNFEGMAFQVVSTYNLGAYWPQTVWLNNAAKGYVKEGDNTIEAFLDLNDDGKYDIGEPYGRLNHVNIGWHKLPETRIELRDGTYNGVPMFEIQSTDDDYDEEQSTSDLNDEGIEEGWVKQATLKVDKAKINGSADDYGVAEFTVNPDGNAQGRLSIVRMAINGIAQSFKRTVWAKNVDVTYGKVYTVADFIPKGQIDLDAKYLVADAAATGISADDIESAEYAVCWDDDSANPFYTFTREFDMTPVAPTLDMAYTNSYYKLLKAQPELSWVGREGYGAFAVQVSENADFSKVIYAATNLLPAASTTGCTFKPDLYVGEELKDKTTYYWRVAQLNAKFTENVWSKVASFSTAVDSINANTGYGKLAAEVRYYGPSDVACSSVIVGVYEAGDFCCAPVARMRLAGNKPINTLTNVTAFTTISTNVVFDGIAPGEYYVMAFVDRNGNGVRDAYETWGYANKIATEETDIYTPVATTVVSYKTAAPEVLIVMEDTDYNQNMKPDCLEDIPDLWVDTDGDGISDEEEEESNLSTDPLNSDTDGDGMPDGWEIDASATDPITPDGYICADGDVMAFAEIAAVCVTDADGNKYLVTNTADKVSVGDDVALNRLVATYEYPLMEQVGTNIVQETLYGVGTNLTSTATVRIERVEDVTAALVHGQVYARFGFDATTATTALGAKNTKSFTALDKYLVVRYLEAMGLADEAAVNADRLWKDYTLKPLETDYDKDGIPDGWELYVMFGPEGAGSVKTLADAAISPWNYDDARDFSPDGKNPDGTKREDVGMRLIDEYDGGNSPTDPWNVDTDGDNVIDKYVYEYILKDAGGDADGDGLSNYAEYLISRVFQFAELDPRNPKTNGSCVDYFRKVGELYFGEVFTDHDQVNDQWEQLYMDKVGSSSDLYANRGIYDPSADWDGDGWSNWAESKAGTNPEVVAQPGPDGNVLPAYPIPTIEARVIYSGSQSLSGALYFQAWSQKTDSGMTGVPDAAWTTSSTNLTRYIGVNPGKTCSYYLGAGALTLGTFKVQFCDLVFKEAVIDATSSNEVSAVSGSTGNARWYPLVYDDGQGVLYTAITNNAVQVQVGTIDYGTGLVTIDFGCEALQGIAYDRSVNGEQVSDGTVKLSGEYSNFDKLDLSRSYVKFEWTPITVSKTGNATYYLSNSLETMGESDGISVKGHVREGLNKFVVWCDNITADGKYTPGEPFGFVSDVDVGWQGGSFTVQLTETSPVFARIDLRVADGETASDRQVWQDGASTVTDIADETTEHDELCKKMGVVYKDGEGTVLSLENTRLTRIRVMRTLVNGEPTLGVDEDGTDISVRRVVLDKYLDLGTRSYLHEGDFLTGGACDCDWDTFQSDIVSRYAYVSKETYGDPIFIDPTNVTYAIVIGEGEIGTSNLIFRCVVNKVFDYAGSRAADASGTPAATHVIRPVVDKTQPQDFVYGARPTFRFAMQDGYGNNYNSYTAFKIRIGSWTSDFKPLPPCDANGWYEWTLDDPIGTKIAASGEYTWSVALYNTKYQSGNYRYKTADWTGYVTEWSDTSTFTVNMNNQQPMNDHGYSSIAATVKYAGPEAVLEGSSSCSYCGDSSSASKVIVQAFTTADFAGVPMGQSYVTDDLADTSKIAANAVIKGLPQTSTYYLRAFIDSNGNGAKDDFESWGAATEPVTISAATVTVPTVGIYIEDADTDGDWLPDAWEYANGGLDAEANTGKIIGADKIIFSGTVGSSGTAGISTGLSGASLTIFQNKAFILAMLPNLKKSGALVSIDEIRSAVEKKVNPNTVKITALTLASDGSKITLSVAAEVTDSIAGTLLGKVYDLTDYVAETASVTIHVYKKDTLATASWTEVGPTDPVTGKYTGFLANVGKDDVEISVELTDEEGNPYIKDMKSGFYKIEVVQ